MKPELYQNSPAGQVIWVGPPGARYCAFVPNPLPPPINADNELLLAASDAAYAVGELAALGRSMQNPHLLINPFIRREAVLSSRIEGTQADIADLYAFEAGQLPLPGLMEATPRADVQEVANYVNALEYGMARLESLPVSLRLLRELHALLLAGVRGEQTTPGEFRKTQNWIGRPGCTISEAEYVPPPVDEMHVALGAFERYLHSEKRTYTRLVQLALVHYQFEAIHPFIDGNGRMGRLLFSLLMVHWNMLPSPLLYLSAYFERHRERYYDLLLQVSQRGAWREWVLFCLAGMVEQARDAGQRAKRLQDLRDDWRQRLSQPKASSLPLSLADSLFGRPVITIPQARDLLGVTYRTAQLNVAKLVTAGILRQLGDATYDKVYAAEEILRIVSDDSVPKNYT